jgi:ATP-binding cassette, subfamily B (MDR/TAP), member 1
MISIRISANMRLAYMKALFKQPISVLDTLPPGQTAAIITITAGILQIGISERLSMFLQSVSLVITALIIAFRQSAILTLVTCSGLVFIAIFYGATMPFLVKMLGEVEHADRMSSGIASEVFSSIRMVAACGAEKKMASRYASWVEESRRRGLKMSPLVAIQQAPGKSMVQNSKSSRLTFYTVFLAIHGYRASPSQLMNALADVSSTFALCFWYAIKMAVAGKITGITTIIV